MRNKFLCLLIALFLCPNLKSQETNKIPPSSINLEAGYIGIFFSAEKFISSKILLRGEIGIDNEFFGGSFFDKNGFVSIPALNVESRYFFSFRELKRKKDIAKNYRGSFLSVKAINTIGSLSFSNRPGISIFSYTHLFPNIGLIRPIGRNWFYQLGIGYGPTFFHTKEARPLNNFEADVLIRIGFRLT